jgi:hypothetical protein
MFVMPSTAGKLPSPANWKEQNLMSISMKTRARASPLGIRNILVKAQVGLSKLHHWARKWNSVGLHLILRMN